MELVFSAERSWALLLIRLALGMRFVAHGAPKVFGWFGGYSLRATRGSFQALGSPPVLGVIECLVELPGGLSASTSTTWTP